MSKEIKTAYHPGYYIKDAIDELQMTQDEFAKRLGISGKQLSLIISKDANVTVDIASKLANLFGTSIDVWINLQTKYDIYLAEIKQLEELGEDRKYYNMIDKKYLLGYKIIKESDTIDTSISNLKKVLSISNLKNLANNDLYSFCRTSVNINEEEHNIVCKNVWISLALSKAKEIKLNSSFDEKKLKTYIPKFRQMTLMDPKEFYDELVNNLSQCGIKFILLNYLKNSNVNGVVKWLDANQVMMALNARNKDADKFWFSFFHELGHVLQKIKRKMIIDVEDEELEIAANQFAMNSLISVEDYNFLINNVNYRSKAEIIEYANKITVHPGIIVGRLQKDGIIPYNHLNELKIQYTINNC